MVKFRAISIFLLRGSGGSDPDLIRVLHARSAHSHAMKLGVKKNQFSRNGGILFFEYATMMLSIPPIIYANATQKIRIGSFGS